MTEPSRSNQNGRRRTLSSGNHWFDASLIPRSRTMGLDTGLSFDTDSRDNESYSLGRQFSKIAVEAFRSDIRPNDLSYISDQFPSDSRETPISLVSRSSEVQQSTCTQVHREHHQCHHHRHRRAHERSQLNQSVTNYPSPEIAHSIPRAGSSSSSRSNLTCRSHPMTISNLRNVSNATVTTNITGTKQVRSHAKTQLYTTPSQPVLFHTSSCGSDEYAEQNLLQSTRSPKRPLSMHVKTKLDHNHQPRTSPDSPLSEKADQAMRCDCKMRLAPSCPSQLEPTMLGLVNANSSDSTAKTTTSTAGRSTNRKVTATTAVASAATATTVTAVTPSKTLDNNLMLPSDATKTYHKSVSKDRLCPEPQRAGTFGLYNIQETIGVGNFSQVKLATHVLTKELVAIKVLDKTRMDAPTRRLLMREISILEMLHHPNIVRLYEVMENLTRLHLVMEFVPGGDLNKRISSRGKFMEKEAKIIFAQLIAAVNHLHERNIFHRDIKADNILFTHRIPTHPQSLNGCNMSPLSGVPNGNRISGVKPAGYHRHIRRWFRAKTREAVRIYPRSRSETRNDSSSRRSTPSESRPFEHKPPKTQLKRSRWDSIHANADHVEAFGDQPSVQDISFCPEYYRVKLVDFGFSKLTLTQDQSLTTFCGSPAYAAPELFQAQNYQGGPVDMWALGIVLFFLLTGLLPYRGSTVGHVRRLVLENRGLQPPEWLSEGARTLYSKLTARQPSDRPTAMALMRCDNPDEKCNLLGASTETSSPKTSAGEGTGDLQPWLTWLSGQIFPKALPRFSKCPPLICSLRRKNANRPEEANTEVSNNASPIRDNKTTTANPDNPTITTKTNPCHTSSPEDEQRTNDDSTRSGLKDQSNKQTNIDVSSPPLSLSSTNANKDPQTYSIQSVQSLAGDAEMEAARMLLELGVTREEMAASENQDSRSAVTGAYRIMLHRAHRARRLSHLDPTRTGSPGNPVGIPSSVSSPQIHHGPTSPTEVNKKRHRTLSPRRTADQAKKTSRFCVML